MSYFIFNNRRSDDMGVMIERLPPIVKPPRKYNAYEKIDRMEIEEVGYLPYEKPIQIGFIERNITDITEWLNGKGKLILSDEPHTYYEAHILNQIDYEKALRFRKARVVFYVQPYKYSNDEEETTSRTVFNQGNIDALPLMTFYGNGQVNLLINGRLTCTLSINGSMTLDSLEQEAYKGSALQNRFMIGEFPKFTPGENIISFTGSGTVTEARTQVRSRWI